MFSFLLSSLCLSGLSLLLLLLLSFCLSLCLCLSLDLLHLLSSELCLTLDAQWGSSACISLLSSILSHGLGVESLKLLWVHILNLLKSLLLGLLLLRERSTSSWLCWCSSLSSWGWNRSWSWGWCWRFSWSLSLSCRGLLGNDCISDLFLLLLLVKSSLDSLLLQLFLLDLVLN